MKRFNSDLLRRLMDEHDLSYAGMAATLGVTEMTVRRLLDGKEPGHETTRAILAQFPGLTYDDLWVDVVVDILGEIRDEAETAAV